MLNNYWTNTVVLPDQDLPQSYKDYWKHRSPEVKVVSDCGFPRGLSEKLPKYYIRSVCWIKKRIFFRNSPTFGVDQTTVWKC